MTKYCDGNGVWMRMCCGLTNSCCGGMRWPAMWPDLTGQHACFGCWPSFEQIRTRLSSVTAAAWASVKPFICNLSSTTCASWLSGHLTAINLLHMICCFNCTLQLHRLHAAHSSLHSALVSAIFGRWMQNILENFFYPNATIIRFFGNGINCLEKYELIMNSIFTTKSC